VVAYAQEIKMTDEVPNEIPNLQMDIVSSTIGGNPTPRPCGHTSNDGEIKFYGGGSRCWSCEVDDRRKHYNPPILRVERRPLSVGWTTLVGYSGSREITGPCGHCGHDHLSFPHYYLGTPKGCKIKCAECEEYAIPIKDPYPFEHGNCCSVINMNSENVEEALRRWPELAEDCEMEVVMLRKREHYRVIDKRLPDSWKKHECTGCGYYERG